MTWFLQTHKTSLLILAIVISNVNIYLAFFLSGFKIFSGTFSAHPPPPHLTFFFFFFLFLFRIDHSELCFVRIFCFRQKPTPSMFVFESISALWNFRQRQNFLTKPKPSVHHLPFTSQAASFRQGDTKHYKT